MLDRSVAPTQKELKPFKIIKAVAGVLKNDIPIYTLNAGKQPIVKLEIVFNAGTYYEPVPGVAYFTSKMLHEGTKNFNFKQLADKFANLGAHFEIETGNDKIVVVLVSLTKHLSQLLPIVDEIIHDSLFVQSNFDNIKAIHLQQLRISMQKSGYVATGCFRKSIFGENHPYGYFMTENMIEAIEMADCLNYYNSFFKNNTFEIIVSGLVNEDTTTEINNVLGQNKYKFQQANPIKKEVRSEISHKVLIEKAETVQSTIRIGKKLFTRKHPDYLKFTVLNEVLGGYFGSRLMKNIREEKGLTYGIFSQVASLINEGYFMIGTDVKKELTTTALTEIYKEIETLKTTIIPEDELETVKSYMIGSYMGSITTPFSLAAKFKTIHFNNLSYDYYDDYIANIKKVKAKDLQLLAQKYFDISAFYEIVVG